VAIGDGMTVQAAFFKAARKALAHAWAYLRGMDRRHKPMVELYPDIISARTSEDLFPKTKGFLDNDLNACTGCEDCISACPVSALSIESSSRIDGSVDVSSFKIDLGRCFSCSICVEICPVNSLTHTSGFEMAAPDQPSLILEIVREKESAPILAGRQRDLRKFRSYEVRR
jgi:formate hydrogenlyase subunit 6/NADH:ubiquinone oxidoreductase subunit I